jgi:large subunit ribosomal protein L13
MVKELKRKKFVIDAAEQAPGRLATQIALILIGKNKVDYEPYIDSGDSVKVLNVDKMKFSGKKLEQKVYQHHSMHPGGLKTIGVKRMMEKHPDEVLRKAVYRMLPKNKLRTARLLRLSFK